MTIMIRPKKVLVREYVFGYQDVSALMHSEALAVRVKKYYRSRQCQHLERCLINSRLYGPYENANAIARTGQAYFEDGEDSRRRYEQNSVQWIQELRRLCTPYLTPCDKLRLELDEIWPSGARLLTLDGLKMFAGLARHFAKGSEAEPHQDVLAWDAPHSPGAARLRGQLAWNTYLSVPEKGGELMLWDIALSRAQYKEQGIPGSYGVRIETLPEPAAVLKPERGEMILFNPGLVHAVRAIETGSRLTVSCFIGFAGPDEQLGIWS